MRLLFSIIAFFTLLVPSANACEPQPILKEGLVRRDIIQTGPTVYLHEVRA